MFAITSFFLWLHGIILFLTGIAVFAPSWTCPKIYELKIYGLVMLASAALPIAGRYIQTFSKLKYPYYQLFFLLLGPLAVSIYSFVPGYAKYGLVFLLALLGVCLLGYDFYLQKKPITTHKDRFFWMKNYSAYLTFSLIITILLIINNSDANTFALFSFLNICLFIGVFCFIHYAKIKPNYFTWFIPILLFFVTFGAMKGGMEVTHYSFFLGPIIEILYGHAHPLAIDIQYGGGLTSFLALYFKLRGNVSFIGLLELLKCLAFIQYLLIFYIAHSLLQSQKLAFMALLTVLAYNFFAPNMNLYYCAPSFGFLRFGFIYLIIGCYLLEKRHVSPVIIAIMTSILGSIAFLWSFESAVYTLPALFFAEYIQKTLRLFLPIFLICFGFILLAYLFPFIAEGKSPPLWRYYEYAMEYANGFGQIPLNRLTSFWWLLPLLYGFMMIEILSGQISNKIVCALTVYGMAIFTYFGGRAHPIYVSIVSIPFILLSFYWILHLKNFSLTKRHLLLSAIVVIFMSAHYVLDPAQTLAQGIWRTNIPLVKQFILEGPSQPFFISDSGSPWLAKSNDDASPNCSLYKTLVPYLENQSIAIVSTDDKNLITFYACTKSHNALGLNTYYETALNPKAVTRAVQRVPALQHHYLLIEANLLKDKVDLWGSELAQQLLQATPHNNIADLKIDGNTYHVLEIERGFQSRTHSPVKGQTASPQKI